MHANHLFVAPLLGLVLLGGCQPDQPQASAEPPHSAAAAPEVAPSSAP